MKEWPLVQGLQSKYGKDRFDVLLMSVDAGFGRGVDYATPEVRRAMNEHGVTWRSVIEPDGWSGVGETFNAHGYGLILVGPDGKVLGVDLRADDIEKQLMTLYP